MILGGRGLKKGTNKNRVPWNKGLKGVQTAWNKGRTGVYTDKANQRRSESMKGVHKGKTLSEEHKRKISITKKNKSWAR